MEDKLPGSCRQTFPLQCLEAVPACSSRGHSGWLHHSYPRTHGSFHRYLPRPRRAPGPVPVGRASCPGLSGAGPACADASESVRPVKSPRRARAAPAFAGTSGPSMPDICMPWGLLFSSSGQLCPPVQLSQLWGVLLCVSSPMGIISCSPGYPSKSHPCLAFENLHNLPPFSPFITTLAPRKGFFLSLFLFLFSHLCICRFPSPERPPLSPSLRDSNLLLFQCPAQAPSDPQSLKATWICRSSRSDPSFSR